MCWCPLFLKIVEVTFCVCGSLGQIQFFTLTFFPLFLWLSRTCWSEHFRNIYFNFETSTHCKLGLIFLQYLPPFLLACHITTSFFFAFSYLSPVCLSPFITWVSNLFESTKQGFRQWKESALSKDSSDSPLWHHSALCISS